MLRSYLFSAARWATSVSFAALTVLGCQSADTFPCGKGTCDLATQVCLIGGADQCSTCVPRPAACDADATCGCVPPANDASWGDKQCDDVGTCAEVEGGLVLTCEKPRWGCG